MRWMFALALALACACSGEGASVVNHQPPTLSKTSVEHLMLRADDIKRSALDAHVATTLAAVFRGRALQVLEAQVHGMEVRGISIQERDFVGTLVYSDSRAGEAVLQVVAQRRLVSPDQPNPTWAATVRQWWARLEYSERTWWIADQEDLTPDRWRVAPAGG